MRLLFSFIFALLFSSLSNAAVHVVKTITVSHSGGDFNSIQAAINSVPDGNKNWTRIHVTAGVYREKVTITAGKGFIYLEGEGAMQTSVEWNDHAVVKASMMTPLMFGLASGSLQESDPVRKSATFSVYAENVVVKEITFKNTYGNSHSSARAVAVLIWVDKVSFYGCRFIGIQDTVADLFGRHYFKNCYIEGAVDFIFGMAQSLYENCILSSVASNAVAGWVTAHGRQKPTDPTGFVFKNCKVVGSVKTYLGRAWSPYSRVIFYQTQMSDAVVPEGWDFWNDPYKGKMTTFIESSCTGAGATQNGRVNWVKRIRNTDLTKITSIAFVDDGWLSQQVS